MSFARSVRVFVSASALALVALTPSLAQASEGEADGRRITTAGHTLQWTWTPVGKANSYGHSETIINAPIETVRKAVLDYSHYSDFNPARFSAARVIGHPEGATDVYMQFSVMRGMLKLWNVLRFANAPRVVRPGYEVHEGVFQRGGGISDANVVWTIKEADANFTVLKADVFIKPDLPAPQSALDEELRDVAKQAVDGVRTKAQGHSRWVHWDAPSSG
jgi:hypothetical protein